jgi:hypothetical protein
MTDDLAPDTALSVLVGSEAWRLRAEEHLRADPARLAAGWERRFIADAARAREAVELYERLGYEVVADPVTAQELDHDCEGCALVRDLGFRTIYTRKQATR